MTILICMCVTWIAFGFSLGVAWCAYIDNLKKALWAGVLIGIFNAMLGITNFYVLLNQIQFIVEVTK